MTEHDVQVFSKLNWARLLQTDNIMIQLDSYSVLAKYIVSRMGYRLDLSELEHFPAEYAYILMSVATTPRKYYIVTFWPGRANYTLQEIQ